MAATRTEKLDEKSQDSTRKGWNRGRLMDDGSAMQREEEREGERERSTALLHDAVGPLPI